MKNFLLVLFTFFSMAAYSQQTVDFEKVTGGATMTLNGNLISFNAPIVTFSNTSTAFAFRINDVVYLFKPAVDHITINGTLMTSQTPAQIVSLLQTTVFNAGGGGGGAFLSLSDVQTNSLANGQIFRYNSGTAKMENFTPPYLTALDFNTPASTGSSMTFDRNRVFNTIASPGTSLTWDTSGAVENTYSESFVQNTTAPTYPAYVSIINSTAYSSTLVNKFECTFYHDRNVACKIYNVPPPVTPYDLVLTQATNLGYTLPGSTYQTEDKKMIDSLVFYHLWDSIAVLYNCASDADVNFGTINWKNPALYRMSKVGGIGYVTKEGYTGGASKFINGNFNPSTNFGTIGSASAFSFGVFVPNGVIDGVAMGSNDLQADYTNIWKGSGFEEWDGAGVASNTGYNFGNTSYLANGTYKFVVVVRLNSTSLKLYVDGTQVATSSQATVAFANLAAYYEARNSLGSASDNSAGTMQLGGAFWGGPLTATQVSKLNQIFNRRWTNIQ